MDILRPGATPLTPRNVGSLAMCPNVVGRFDHLSSGFYCLLLLLLLSLPGLKSWPETLFSLCPCVRPSVSLLQANLRRHWPDRCKTTHTHSLDANSEPLSCIFHLALLQRHHEADLFWTVLLQILSINHKVGTLYLYSHVSNTDIFAFSYSFLIG